jgi:acyl-CoA synthetase (NDP forming)
LIKDFTKPENILIITNAGGPSISLVDCIQKTGCDYNISIKDIIGDATSVDYKNALIESNKGKYNLIIIIASPQTNTDFDGIAKEVLEYNKKYKKNIIVSFLNTGKYIEHFMDFYKQGILPYYFPEKYFQTVSKIKNLKKDNRKIGFTSSKRKEINKILKSNENSHIKPFLVFDLLKLPTIKTKIAENFPKVVKAVNEFGYPVVLKTASEQIIHKKQSGGIFVNICNFKELKEKYIRLSKISKDVLIQPMRLFVEEIIIGGKKDENGLISFVFGKGGTYTEKTNDISIACSPFLMSDFEIFKSETKTGNLLNDKLNKKLLDIYLKLEYLLKTFEISEIDLNPVKIDPETGEVLIVDARII